MKKVSRCVNCERKIYTNDLNLCKKCYRDVGLEFLKQQEPEEVEEGPASLAELGIEAGKDGGVAEEAAEESTEEVKE